MKKEIASEFVHAVPKDLKKILALNPDISGIWNGLTPLARNEWVCWVTIVKKLETRKEHIERFQVDLLNGKRRPCCLPGCPHRRPNMQKWFSKRK